MRVTVSPDNTNELKKNNLQKYNYMLPGTIPDKVMTPIKKPHTPGNYNSHSTYNTVAIGMPFLFQEPGK